MSTVKLENQNDALNALINAAKVAVKRGAFEIEEVEIILKAIRLFVPEEVQKVEADAKQEVVKTDKKIKQLV